MIKEDFEAMLRNLESMYELKEAIKGFMESKDIFLVVWKDLANM